MLSDSQVAWTSGGTGPVWGAKLSPSVRLVWRTLSRAIGPVDHLVESPSLRLKTWLETGELLTTPGSQMYSPS